MLASRSGRRLKITPWFSTQQRRHLTNGKHGLKDENNRNGQAFEHVSRRIAPDGTWGLKNANDKTDHPTLAREESCASPSRSTSHALSKGPADKAEGNAKKPSLMEQLFPVETKRLDTAHETKLRELPPMPVARSTPQPAISPSVVKDDNEYGTYKSPAAWRLYRRRKQDMEVEGEQPTVLLLRNASTNLTEEDFRRVTPRGKHLEGWTVEESTFTKIVPGRNLATLQQENFYYLLFAHQMAAFIYQGHVSRLAALARHYTPSSVTSPAAPPPGYQLNDGTDLYAVLQSYTLAPASQNLELRQLEPPLSPLLQAIIEHQGYPSFVNRPDKSPFEVRLTLDGPQLKISAIQYILHESALARSLGWSGGTARIPHITIWEPRFAPSPRDKNVGGQAEAWALRLRFEATEQDILERDMERQGGVALKTRESSMETDDHRDSTNEDDYDEDIERPKVRQPNRVYIVGFITESAAQAFVRYWHKRPMCWEGKDGTVVGSSSSGDLLSIANTELLW